MRLVPIALSLALMAAVAEGQVTSVTLNLPSVPGSPAGFTVYDIFIDFEGQLFGQQMVVELTRGSIFQSFIGGETAPNAAFFSVIPDLATDTFVTLGGFTSQESADVIVVGGSTEIPGKSRPKQFDSQGLNVAWAPAPGVVIDGGRDFPMARLTLSNDARGEFWFYSNAAAEPIVVAAAIETLGLLDAYETITAVSVESPNLPAVPAGVVTNDISIDFDGVLHRLSLAVELTAGSIYQDAISGDTPPDRDLITAIPSLAADTFFAAGGFNSDDSLPVEVYDCDSPSDETTLCKVWEAQSPVVTEVDFAITRLSLTDDAEGIVTLYKDSYLGLVPFATATIRGGVVMLVPEPTATVHFLTLAAACGLTRRNRTRD